MAYQCRLQFCLDFLQDHKQYVKIRNIVSNTISVDLKGLSGPNNSKLTINYLNFNTSTSLVMLNM